jgi:hypothetical protein
MKWYVLKRFRSGVPLWAAHLTVFYPNDTVYSFPTREEAEKELESIQARYPGRDLRIEWLSESYEAPNRLWEGGE